MKKTRRAGFTLVELLTVVAIIALLAALILGLASNAQSKAAESRAESEVSQLAGVVTDYQVKYGQVPANKEVLADFLTSINHSLTNENRATEMPLDPWGNHYEYERTSPVTFYLYSKGKDPDNRAGRIGEGPE